MIVNNDDLIFIGNTRIEKVTQGETVLYVNYPYTKLHYIQADGNTQYINTLITPTQDYIIECQFLMPSGSGGAAIFGSRFNDVNGLFVSARGGGWAGFGSSEGRTSGMALPSSTIYHIKMDKTGIYRIENDTKTLLCAFAANDFTSSNTLSIFREGNKNHSSSRLYFMKIWNGETLIRDFIPVLDPAGVACLYDLVSQTYFYNQGTGQFIPGFIIPDEYEQLTYIKPQNHAYIDTGIIPTSIQIDATFKLESSSSNITLFGTQKHKGGDYIHFTSYNHQWYWGLNNGEDHGGSIQTNRICNLIFNNDSNRVIVDDTDIGSCLNTTSDYSLDLFRREQWSDNIWWVGSLYWMRIKDKNTGKIVRDFIPAKRKSDFVVGLFDRVTKTFYTNSGDGSFIGE